MSERPATYPDGYPALDDGDYACNCGRRQRHVGRSGVPMLPNHVESFGWRAIGGRWHCPFCTGNTENLRRVFGKDHDA